MTKREIEQAIQRADDDIMTLCEPKKMKPAEALDFLEGVISRCRSAIEALKEENEDLN